MIIFKNERYEKGMVIWGAVGAVIGALCGIATATNPHAIAAGFVLGAAFRVLYCKLQHQSKNSNS